MSYPIAGASSGVRTGEILLVEDNAADIRLTQEALREGRVAINLRVARDGVQALEMLRREGPYANLPLPDLVLLDLNLPRKDGREVLAEMKRDDTLRRIPVCVLSTSKADRDVQVCYDLHANCYLRKPLDFDEFAALIRSVEDYWFQRVQLPPRHAARPALEGAHGR